MANTQQLLVPDIGDADSVEVIEVLVKVGDQVNAEDSLITLESDKASMEIPSPFSGTIKELNVKVGDQLAQGAIFGLLEEAGAASTPAPAATAPPQQTTTETAAVTSAPANDTNNTPVTASQSSDKAHASPAVRKFAREQGVDLHAITGTGPKQRITKADIENHLKHRGSTTAQGALPGVATLPDVDFAAFGDIELEPLTKINKLTGKYLHRSWFYVPHVTQFDEADITELDAFRKQQSAIYKEQGIKITMVAFLLKAVAAALIKFPRVNASLDSSGENLILKKYVHIAVAVDTPDGLVVPVIRDVDKKGIVELAQAVTDIASRARQKKIKPAEMQGACFTISSLGGIGGTAFTPIVNQPEVAILGVSRSSIKPVYQNGEFVPRLMLPLSLSYDHRVIDGVVGAQFTTYLGQVLADIRQLVM